MTVVATPVPVVVSEEERLALWAHETVLHGARLRLQDHARADRGSGRSLIMTTARRLWCCRGARVPGCGPVRRTDKGGSPFGAQRHVRRCTERSG